jgi:predicted nucleic acid-binding protein
MSCYVLDTNAVLDTWWFEDPQCRRLRQALAAGEGRWLHTRPMRDELLDVLQRPAFIAHPDRCERTLSALDLYALGVETRDARAPWTCRDPDDQPFLDLALQQRPCWLLTRDRALLDLAGRAAAEQVWVLTPAQWAQGLGGPPAARTARPSQT